MTEPYITQEEKINYIYSMLRKNEKKAFIGGIFKWWYRLTMLGYMYYFFAVSLPAIMDKIPSFSGSGEGMKMQELLQNPQIKALYESYLSK